MPKLILDKCRYVNPQGTQCPNSPIENSYLCAEHIGSGNPEMDRVVFQAVNDHFLQDIREFFTRSNFYLVAEVALLSIFLARDIHENFSMSAGIAIIGLLIAIFWGIVAWNSYKYIGKWRKELKVLDNSLDRFRSIAEIEPDAGAPDKFSPENITKFLPVLFGIIWLALGWVLVFGSANGTPEPSGNGKNIGALFKGLSKSTHWKLAKKIKLKFSAHHPQGMVKVGLYFYISSVEFTTEPEKHKKPVEPGKPDRTEGEGVGHLFKVDEEGNLVDSITLGDKAGAIYHPGGIDYDGKWLWVPVAQARPHSSSIMYKVNIIGKLSSEPIFEIGDHIGGVVYNRKKNTLHGVSWGSRKFYTWDMKGNEIRSAQNGSHYVDYQDCQYVKDSLMLCGGMNEYRYPGPEVGPDPEDGKFALGGIALIDLETNRAIHQIPLMVHAGNPKTDPRIVMTRNPIFAEFWGDRLKFYFMPENKYSTIYIFSPRKKEQ